MQTISNHAVKVNRAVALSRIGGVTGGGDHDIPQGGCAASALAMLDAIPASVIAHLTSSSLADLIDAMWITCQQAKAIAEADAVKEGAVWDAAQSRLREIAA